MTTTLNLTIDNFTKETGLRFRVTKLQAARIALTELDDVSRQGLVGLSTDQVADNLSARNAKGKPFNWVETAVELLPNWEDAMQLDREGAFREFLNDGGLERLQNRRPEIPDSVYLDPDLTLDNFPQKVEAAIGVACRFRMSRDQKTRKISREDALAEIVAAKRTTTNETEELDSNEQS
jgi:hypothetical protein